MYCYNKTCPFFSTADNGNCTILREQKILTCEGRLFFQKEMEILKAWGVDTKRLMGLIDRYPVGVKEFTLNTLKKDNP